MSAPSRIQRKRTAGWRMPEGAVYVGRPTKWGNPWLVEMYVVDWPGFPDKELRRMATSDFRGALEGRWPMRPEVAEAEIAYPSLDEIRRELRGKDLACWCPLDQPCHADVLIELANR